MDYRGNKGIEYTFNREEAVSVCYATGRLQPYKRRSALQSLLAMIAVGFFSYEIIRDPADIFAYAIVLIGIVLLISCWVLPRRFEDECMNGYSLLDRRVVNLDARAISLSRGNEILLVKPNEVINYGTANEIVIISTADGRHIEFPLRAATNTQLEHLDNIINSSSRKTNLIP